MTFALEVLNGVRWRGATVPGARQRTLLALLLEATTVSDARLIDDIWPDGAPENPSKALQVVVARTRKTTTAGAVERTADGYRLSLPAAEVDVLSLLDDAARARAAAAAGRWDDALVPARAVLALSSVTEDDADGPLGRLRRAAGAAVRESAVIAGTAAAHLGRHAEALELLDVDAVRDDEPALAALLRSIAAHRSTAAALAAYADHREYLIDRVGAEPGPPLRRVHAELLAAERPVRSGIRHGVTDLVGRDGDIAEVNRLIRTGRLTTILGPGGLGKTRLAQAVGQSADHPVVHFIELAGVRSPDGLWPAIAGAIDSPIDSGLRGGALGARAGGSEPRRRVLDALAGLRTLLILDNCEQVIDAVAQLVGALLAALPDLTVLTTSRSPLAISGERVHSPGQLIGPDGSRLFAERAAAVRPGASLNPETVATLVRRLDGLPLAIELAAARVTALSPEQILDRLESRLGLPEKDTRDTPDRHRTLDAVIDWSWELLASDDRRALAWLTVFHDGFTLDAAEHLLLEAGIAAPGAVADQLLRLVGHSLLTVIDDGRIRFRLLETVREFGRERLADNGDDAAAGSAFRRWAVATARPMRAALGGPSQLATMALVRAEHTNLLTELTAALPSSAHSPADRIAAVELASALFTFWDLDGDSERVMDLVGQIVPLLDGFDPPKENADATRDLLSLVLTFGVMLHNHVSPGLEAALRALGPGDDPWVSAFVVVVLDTLDELGDVRPVSVYSRDERIDTTLRRLSDDPRRRVAMFALRWRGYILEGQGHVVEAVEVMERSLSLHNSALDGLGGEADLRTGCAAMLQQLGRFGEAATEARRAFDLLETLGSTRGGHHLLPIIAMGELVAGRADEADRLMQSALANLPVTAPWAVGARERWLAETAMARGDYAAARDLYRTSLRQLEDLVLPGHLEALGPWFRVVGAACVLAASARIARGDGDASPRSELAAFLFEALRDPPSVDYPSAGSGAFALGLWELARGAAAPAEAVDLLVLAERMGYSRNSLALDWSFGEQLERRCAPGQLDRSRRALADVPTAELAGEVIRRLDRLVGSSPRVLPCPVVSDQ